MAKFYDVVGYAETIEDPTDSGIFVDQITEVSYYGEVIRNSRQLVPGEKLNDDISIGNSISIIADEYAIAHIFAIRYVKWAGALWTVTTVEVKSPRLLLSLGNLYNGPVYIPPEEPVPLGP